MGQSVSVKWDGSPQKPCEEDGQASIVFSSLDEDPHGQIRLPRSQCACEPRIWNAIVQAAKDNLHYTQPSRVHSPRRDPMREKAKEFVAQLARDHQELRISYRGVWVTWNTATNGQRILDDSLKHWEHVLHISNPAGPVRSAKACERSVTPRLVLPEFPDPRQPVDASLYKLTFDPVGPLPSNLKGQFVRQESDDDEIDTSLPLSKASPKEPGGCLSGLTKSFRRSPNHCKSKPSEALPVCRWYKVFPISDIGWLLRPELGPVDRVPKALQIPGLSQVSDELVGPETLRRRWSVPHFIERKMCLPDPPGFECDAFRNCCRICYDRDADVISLPCGHGGLCEQCLRSSLLSRPPHRGGRSCPFCRRCIEQVARLYRHGSIQYAYAIKML